MRACRSVCLSTVVACVLGATLLVACASSPPASPSGTQGHPTEPLWRLPFPDTTTITLGTLGLHDDNFGSTQVSDTDSTTFILHGAGNDPATGDVPDASLDLLPLNPPAPVVAMAPGTVLAVWSVCHLVLIDHGWPDAQGRDIWAIYLHVDATVKPGDAVGSGSVLGHTAASITAGKPCFEQSEGVTGAPIPHVHIAFLRGSGHTGTYLSMAGRWLCVGRVQPDGGLHVEQSNPEMTFEPGQTFAIDQCAG